MTKKTAKKRTTQRNARQHHEDFYPNKVALLTTTLGVTSLVLLALMISTSF